jgi:uncharacterized RDD family membrane protein YckC
MGDLEEQTRLDGTYPGVATLSPDRAATAPEHGAAPDPTRVVLRRCAQFAIEQAIALILCIVLLFLTVVVVAKVRQAGAGEGAARVATWACALALMGSLIVLDWWFAVWLPYRGRGATPGMRLVGLRIVTERGEAPALRAYMIRWLLMAVDGAFYGIVGLVVMAASRRHQRVGDMVAHTLVVRRTAVPDPPTATTGRGRSPRPR